MATAQLTDNHIAKKAAAEISKDLNNIAITSSEQALQMLLKLGFKVIISDEEPDFVPRLKNRSGAHVIPVQCLVVYTDAEGHRAYIPPSIWEKQAHEMSKAFLAFRALGHLLFDCRGVHNYYLDSAHYWFQHWAAERRAALFAGHVLMPHAVFDNHIQSCKLSEGSIDLQELSDKMHWPEDLTRWWGRQLHYFSKD